VFAARGAPVSVLLDFDGTISLRDVGDALLARFAPDQDEVARIDGLYSQGVLPSRDLVRWDMDVLPRDPAVLRAALDELSLDPSLLGLVALVEGVGGAIEIVSDGVGFHVEPMLSRLGLDGLPVATNASEPGRGGEGMAFPFGHPDCLVCGTCKRERVRLHQAAGRAVVFVGDGASDRYAVHHADVTFAKASLAHHCEARGIGYQPYERLSDVTTWLCGALASGRLPRDTAAFEGWARAHRRAPVTFICGPEVWGPGALVPPPGEVGAPPGE
jgi:2,3-diketo-5-methylthio-1-phosphopentane phosphatase